MATYVSRLTNQGADPACRVPALSKYTFDPTASPGYVWHCHIVDHEDNEMMRPMIVTK